MRNKTEKEERKRKKRKRKYVFVFDERVAISESFKFERTNVRHLQTLSINRRVIANIEMDPSPPLLIDFSCSRFMIYASRPFISPRPASTRLVNPWPISSDYDRIVRGSHVHTSADRRGTTDPGNCICYIFFHSENETVQMVRGIDYVYVVLITSRFHPGLMTRSYLMLRMDVIY